MKILLYICSGIGLVELILQLSYPW